MELKLQQANYSGNLRLYFVWFFSVGKYIFLLKKKTLIRLTHKSFSRQIMKQNKKKSGILYVSLLTATALLWSQWTSCSQSADKSYPVNLIDQIYSILEAIFAEMDPGLFIYLFFASPVQQSPSCRRVRVQVRFYFVASKREDAADGSMDWSWWLVNPRHRPPHQGQLALAWLSRLTP